MKNAPSAPHLCHAQDVARRCLATEPFASAQNTCQARGWREGGGVLYLKYADQVPSASAKQGASASIAQLAEHALRKRMVVGSIPTGGFFAT